jgi:hypothetical protein
MMKKYAITNPDGSLQEDVTFEQFQTAQQEGKIVWIAEGDGPYIMQV